MVGVVSVFSTAAISYSLFHKEEQVVVSYTPQQVRRVGPDGVTVIPTIEGYDLPAVYVDETVPVISFVTVKGDHNISATGTVYWQLIPPGQSFKTGETARLLVPGVTQLTFENEIPQVVVDYVNTHGATKWQVRGRVAVNEPHTLDATWQTETFWILSRP